MSFKPMHGNVVKSIRLLKPDGAEDIVPIHSQQSWHINETYKIKAEQMEEGDDLFVHVTSRANASSDENTKYFF